MFFFVALNVLIVNHTTQVSSIDVCWPKCPSANVDIFQWLSCFRQMFFQSFHGSTRDLFFQDSPQLVLANVLLGSTGLLSTIIGTNINHQQTWANHQPSINHQLLLPPTLVNHYEPTIIHLAASDGLTKNFGRRSTLQRCQVEMLRAKLAEAEQTKMEVDTTRDWAWRRCLIWFS